MIWLTSGRLNQLKNNNKSNINIKSQWMWDRKKALKCSRLWKFNVQIYKIVKKYRNSLPCFSNNIRRCNFYPIQFKFNKNKKINIRIVNKIWYLFETQIQWKLANPNVRVTFENKWFWEKKNLQKVHKYSNPNIGSIWLYLSIVKTVAMNLKLFVINILLLVINQTFAYQTRK